MKKYIKPTIVVATIETSALCVNSPLGRDYDPMDGSYSRRQDYEDDLLEDNFKEKNFLFDWKF